MPLKKIQLILLPLTALALTGFRAAPPTPDAVSTYQACHQAGAHRVANFVFVGFDGQQVRLTIDNAIVLDATLSSRQNLRPAVSLYMSYPVNDDSCFSVMIDRATIYDGHLSEPETCTIYINASPANVEQTTHPTPLLD